MHAKKIKIKFTVWVVILIFKKKKVKKIKKMKNLLFDSFILRNLSGMADGETVSIAKN